jgi:hypothetical protein
MEDATTSPIARYERPKSQDGGKTGRMGGAARRARSTSWPAEVSRGARGVFTSHRTLTGLRAVGLPVDQIRIEVRSRKGAGVWVMARGLGNPIAHGRILSEATTALITMLAPDVEEVRDIFGKTIR